MSKSPQGQKLKEWTFKLIHVNISDASSCTARSWRECKMYTVYMTYSWCSIGFCYLLLPNCKFPWTVSSKMTSTLTIMWMECFTRHTQCKAIQACSTTTWQMERGGSRPLSFSAMRSGRFVHFSHPDRIITTLCAVCHPPCTVIYVQVRNDLQILGCAAMLDKYDSYTVKVKFI